MRQPQQNAIAGDENAANTRDRSGLRHDRLRMHLAYVTATLICLTAYAWARGMQAGLPGSASGPAGSIPARQWAIDASQNEIKVIEYGNAYLRYRVHILGSKGDQVRDVLESKDGTVARLILRDNRPLTAAEDAAEHDRLQTMLNSPSAFASHIHGDVTGKKMAVQMLKLLPDAMTYTYAAGQPQRTRNGTGAASAPEIVIDFKPNPNWVPPDMASEALTGLQGRAWVDAKTHHMTKLDGVVFRSVNFGWGIFAHVYPGGQISLEQVRVSDQRWIFSRFVEHVTIRALMVKTLRENSEIEASRFTPVREMSYRDAIHLLLSSPLPAN